MSGPGPKQLLHVIPRTVLTEFDLALLTALEEPQHCLPSRGLKDLANARVAHVSDDSARVQIGTADRHVATGQNDEILEEELADMSRIRGGLLPVILVVDVEFDAAIPVVRIAHADVVDTHEEPLEVFFHPRVVQCLATFNAADHTSLDATC